MNLGEVDDKDFAKVGELRVRGRAPLLLEAKSVASFAQLRWFNLKTKNLAAAGWVAPP